MASIKEISLPGAPNNAAAEAPAKPLSFQSDVATEAAKWKAYKAAIIALLLLVIGCSVAPMFGDNEGWLYWHKSDYQIDTSPYVGLLKYIFIIRPRDGVDPDLVDVLNPLLPHVPADVTATMGWRNSVSKVTLHNPEPMDDFLITFAISMVPSEFADSVRRVLTKGEDSLTEEYTGRKEPAKYTGALSVIFLGLSAVYAIVCLTMVVYEESIMIEPSRARWLLSKSWIVAGLLYVMMGTEYVVVAVGTHRELKDHPVVQKGYIARPDWALIIAVLAATSWAVITIIMFASQRASKKDLCTTLPKKPEPSVATKQSWNIPAIKDVEGESAV